jgi:ubiquinone/menaquinone biosynthesis C-methylase UbiE
MDVKATVQQQFTQVAVNYRTSSVHALGSDLQQMVALAALTGDEDVLDAGCGAGHTAMAFAPHVHQVVAYDFTESMLEQVRSVAEERQLINVLTKQGDVESLPFPDAVFDLIVSRYSAHHWPHPVQALREFHRVLKPRGRLILDDIVSWDDAPVLDTFLQSIELIRDPSHVRDHSPSQWLEMFNRAGFAAQLTLQWNLPLAFIPWVERMRTPAVQVDVLKRLMAGGSAEVQAAFAIESNCNFSIPSAIFMAEKRS